MNGWVIAKDAEEQGFKTFNKRAIHLCVDIPDGWSTVTCRLSNGKRVTFAFVPYEHEGVPQCVDVTAETGEVVMFKDAEGMIPLHIQAPIVFGKGPTYYRREKEQLPTLTTVMFHQPR